MSYHGLSLKHFLLASTFGPVTHLGGEEGSMKSTASVFPSIKSREGNVTGPTELAGDLFMSAFPGPRPRRRESWLLKDRVGKAF